MRIPKPFFRKSLQCWYLKLGKKFIRLAPDRDEAHTKYHAIMADRKPAVTGADGTVANVIGQYLAWAQGQCDVGNMKAGTFGWYERFLNSFIAYLNEKHPGLTIANLKTHHVKDWRDANSETWGPSGKRGAVVSVKRALNWAADDREIIPANPVKKIQAGKQQSREIYITPEQWQAALSAVDDCDPFKQVLLFLKATGCRPGEAAIADCRHVDRERKVIVLGISEWKCGKKTGKKRTIYLNDEALSIVDRAYVRVGQKGRLFQNRKQQPFSVGWIGKKFASLQETLREQFGPDFDLYAYAIRHTWITDKLKEGVDVCTVAKLAGTSAEMVQEVYCQIGLNEEHLHNAARAVPKVVTA